MTGRKPGLDRHHESLCHLFKDLITYGERRKRIAKGHALLVGLKSVDPTGWIGTMWTGSVMTPYQMACRAGL